MRKLSKLALAVACLNANYNPILSDAPEAGDMYTSLEMQYGNNWALGVNFAMGGDSCPTCEQEDDVERVEVYGTEPPDYDWDDTEFQNPDYPTSNTASDGSGSTGTYANESEPGYVEADDCDGKAFQAFEICDANVVTNRQLYIESCKRAGEEETVCAVEGNDFYHDENFVCLQEYDDELATCP